MYSAPIYIYNNTQLTNKIQQKIEKHKETINYKDYKNCPVYLKCTNLNTREKQNTKMANSRITPNED